MIRIIPISVIFILSVSISVIATAGTDSTQLTWEKLNKNFLHLKESAKFEQAKDSAKNSLIIARTKFGKNSEQYIISLNNLALINKILGQIKEAELLYLESASFAESAYVDNNIIYDSYPTILTNLASLYNLMHQYKSALNYGHKALKLSKQLLKYDDSNTAYIYNTLADSYYKLSDFNTAENLYLLSLSNFIKKFGRQNSNVAITLNELAILYTKKRNYAKAEQLCKDALNIQKKIYSNSPNHPDIAATYNNYAALYYSTGKFDEALELYKKALIIYKVTYNEIHPEVAASLNNIGTTYFKINDLANAELVFIKALNIRKKVLPANDMNTASSLFNLGFLYLKQNQSAKAYKLIKESLSIRKQYYPHSHRFILETKKILDSISIKSGS